MERKDSKKAFHVLEYNGVPFSPLGGIQVISGHNKSGKTFALTQMMAAILCTGTKRVEQMLPGLRMPQRTLEHIGHPPRVLFVDTEMEMPNLMMVLRRVHWLCGLDTDTQHDQFSVLWLRQVTRDETTKEAAYQKRYRLIKMAIDETKPDVVFIDGVRDIIGDSNDNEESSDIVSDLMALADTRQMSIWLVLNTNSLAKMRGHLGTELGNRVTDTLVCTKKNDASTGEATFTVQHQDARKKDMDDWKFEITDVYGNLEIPRIIDTTIAPPTKEERYIQAAENTYNQLMDSLKNLREYITPVKYNPKSLDLFVAIQIGGELTTIRQIAEKMSEKLSRYILAIEGEFNLEKCKKLAKQLNGEI